jgi:hypothetical protein
MLAGQLYVVHPTRTLSVLHSGWRCHPLHTIRSHSRHSRHSCIPPYPPHRTALQEYNLGRAESTRRVKNDGARVGGPRTLTMIPQRINRLRHFPRSASSTPQHLSR